MVRPKRDLQRVTMNLPPHIVQMCDEYAEKNGLSRTTAVVVLLANALAELQREGES